MKIIQKTYQHVMGKFRASFRCPKCNTYLDEKQPHTSNRILYLCNNCKDEAEIKIKDRQERTDKAINELEAVRAKALKNAEK